METGLSDRGLSGNALSEVVSDGEDITKRSQGQADPEKKAVTFMLYGVGSNLERGFGGTTLDLEEIMKGIYKATVSRNETGEIYRDSSGNEFLRNPSVNFVVETGGMKFNDDGEKKAYDDVMSGEISKRREAADIKGEQLVKSISENIKYTENERWILTGSGVERAENDEGTIRNRVMTKSDGSGVVPELLDFIDTTTEKYPADQYMLVLWDHGGGPLFGYGSDERDEDPLITSLNVAKTMAATKAFGKDKRKLAFVGYDACLMGNLETAIAWAPYARYYAGSEEVEGGTGWDYCDFIYRLESFVSKNGERLSDEDMNKLTVELGKVM